MSVFGFIENFFFVSLALVFMLVIFLVYHFKNRITVAEKKSESMYGLLTAVVKEIKTLRGMFGLGGNATAESIQSAEYKGQTKTVPEVDVDVEESFHISSSESAKPHTFLDYVENVANNIPGRSENREVITFEITPSENKIVVSDDDESTVSDDSDSDSDSEFEQEQSDKPVQHQIFDNFQISEEILDLDLDLDLDIEVRDVSLDIEQIEQVELNDDAQNTSATLEEVELVREDLTDIIHPSTQTQVQVYESNLEVLHNENEEPDRTEIVVDLSSISPQIPSLEQLRKMNINQLKGIASQIGITVDVSKMKKPELISLIRES
jgi:hypothetical protein